MFLLFVLFMLLFCILTANFNVIERLCGYKSRLGLELLRCHVIAVTLDMSHKLLWNSVFLVKIRSNVHLIRWDKIIPLKVGTHSIHANYVSANPPKVCITAVLLRKSLLKITKLTRKQALSLLPRPFPQS